jgi:hypothetical protein
MDIKVKSSKLFYGGEYHKLFNLQVSSGNAIIDEDIDEKDVLDLVVQLLDQTVLDNLYWNYVVERLVEVGILDNKQILEYVQNLQEDEE